MRQRRGLISKTDATTYLFDPATICGQPALFCDEHIQQDTVPKDVFVYELRHDEHGNPTSVELRVDAHFYGAILTSCPLDVDCGHALALRESDFRFMDGERMSLASFHEALPPGKELNHV